MKWVYEGGKSLHYYEQNATTPSRWDEFSDNKWTKSYELQTYEGDNVILYNRKSKTYVELSSDQMKLGLGPIESLDESSIVFNGKWQTMSSRSRLFFVFVKIKKPSNDLLN